MSEQFPNTTVDFNDSQQALEYLIKTMEASRDSRYLLWIAQLAKDACEKKIVDTQQAIVRQREFGYELDLARSQAWLADYQVMWSIVQAMLAFARLLSMEMSMPDFAAYKRAKKNRAKPRKTT